MLVLNSGTVQYSLDRDLPATTVGNDGVVLMNANSPIIIEDGSTVGYIDLKGGGNVTLVFSGYAG